MESLYNAWWLFCLLGCIFWCCATLLGAIACLFYAIMSAVEGWMSAKEEEGKWMQDWRQRVFDEHSELDAKIEKLEAFLKAPPSIDVEDHGLLCAQLMAMQTYRGILAKRIERFNQ